MPSNWNERVSPEEGGKQVAQPGGVQPQTFGVRGQQRSGDRKVAAVDVVNEYGKDQEAEHGPLRAR